MNLVLLFFFIEIIQLAHDKFHMKWEDMSLYSVNQHHLFWCYLKPHQNDYNDTIVCVWLPCFACTLHTFHRKWFRNHIFSLHNVGTWYELFNQILNGAHLSKKKNECMLQCIKCQWKQMSITTHYIHLVGTLTQRIAR